MRLYIRERRKDERNLHDDIFRAAYHVDMHSPDMEEWEEMQDESGTVLRLLALMNDRPVGSGEIATMPFLPDNSSILTLAVHPTAQGRGIGTAMYGRLLDFAVSRGLADVQCTVHKSDVNNLRNWLNREGFVEWNRTRVSELNLGTLDMPALRAAECRILDQGLELTTLHDDDTEDNRHKLWRLHLVAHRDVPWGPQGQEMPYERFARRFEPPYMSDCTVIAREGNNYIGFTQPVTKSFGVAGTSMTGVHPAYRNRGIARGVKSRCAMMLHQRGYTTMRTMNHVSNAAMLAVNRALGYVASSDIVYFKKQLRS